MYVFGGGDAKYWLNDLDMLNLSKREWLHRELAMDEVRDEGDAASREIAALSSGVWVEDLCIRG